MPYTICTYPELPMIEICYIGVVAETELSDSFDDAVELVNQHNIRNVLADCTNLTGGHSMLDLYNKADTFESIAIAHSIKEAVLLPKFSDSIEKVKFWETTCNNRGLRVQIFDDRQTALAWLLA